MSKKIGIYSIFNKISGKSYIGQAIDMKRRFIIHRYRLNKGNHVNSHLQNSWNKYGKNNFKFKIIEECDKMFLNQIEQFYIDKYDFDKLYNIAHCVKSPMLGRKHSEETKEKIRVASTNPSEETRAKMSESGKLSWNTNRKIHMSKVLKGKKCTKETKEKIRQKKLGVKLSDSHRKSIANSKRGSKLSEEHKEALSLAKYNMVYTYKESKLKNRKTSQETKDKISTAHNGRIHKGIPLLNMTKGQKNRRIKEKERNYLLEALKIIGGYCGGGR